MRLKSARASLHKLCSLNSEDDRPFALGFPRIWGATDVARAKLGVILNVLSPRFAGNPVEPVDPATELTSLTSITTERIAVCR
jgi:hypothetical protein